MFVPFLTVLVYLIARGKGMNERALAHHKAQEAAVQQYIQASAGSTSVAGELSRLADLRDRGAISEDEFAAAKAKLIA